MSPSWQRLIRFEDSENKVQYGDAVLPKDCKDIGEAATKGTLRARLIQPSKPFFEALLQHNPDSKSHDVQVKRLLAPLSKQDVPIIRCIGLNYIKHSMRIHARIDSIIPLTLSSVQEAGRAPPPYPSLFIKPSGSVADWGEDIPIPKTAQATCDYEGELVRFPADAAYDQGLTTSH